MRTRKGIMNMTAALIIFSLCLATAGYSQDVLLNTHDWNILKSIPTGRQLQVNTKNGKSISGILDKITDTSLLLTTKEESFSLQSNEVANVYVLGGRPIAKRTLIGAGVGTGVGATIGLISGRGDSLVGALGGSLGLVIGSITGLVQGLSKKKGLVYETHQEYDYSRFEISGAYSIMRVQNPENTAVISPYNTFNIAIRGKNDINLGGSKLGIGFNLNRHFGIVGEFGSQYSQTTPFQISLNNVGGSSYCSPASDCVKRLYWDYKLTNRGSREIYTLLAGPRFSMDLSKRIRPFAHVLMGLGRNSLDMEHSYGVIDSQGAWKARIGVSVEFPSRNLFAIACGGGLDIKINKRLSIRPIEIESVNTQEYNPSYFVYTTLIQYSGARPTSSEKTDQVNGIPDKKWTNNMRLSFGAVFHFNKKFKRSL
jgi:hypothetical protein